MGSILPAKTTVSTMGQVVVVTKMITLKNNIEIDESVFDTPAEIKELMQVKSEATVEKAD